MRFAKAIFRERRKRESWRAFSCPRSKEPHCFARLTAVSSPCGGSSGFFSARSSQRIRDGKGRLSEYLWGPLLRCVQELMYSGMDGETTAECFYENLHRWTVRARSAFAFGRAAARETQRS